VVATETLTAAGDASAIAARVAPLGPGAVLFAGEATAADAVATQLRNRGLAAPLITGSAACEEPGVRAAPALTLGDLCVVPGVDGESHPAAQAFREDYAAAGLPVPPGPLGAVGYDAANLLIDAAARALPATSIRPPAGEARSARTAIAAILQAMVRSGATGPLSFDQYGDLLVQSGTVRRWDGTEWITVGSRTAG